MIDTKRILIVKTNENYAEMLLELSNDSSLARTNLHIYKASWLTFIFWPRKAPVQMYQQSPSVSLDNHRRLNRKWTALHVVTGPYLPYVKPWICSTRLQNTVVQGTGERSKWQNSHIGLRSHVGLGTRTATPGVATKQLTTRHILVLRTLI